MKGISDPFEEELKQRLQRYEEEPQRDLWTHIAPQILPVSSKSVSSRWKWILSFIALVTPVIMGYLQNELKGNSLFNHISKTTTVTESLATSLLNVTSSSSHHSKELKASPSTSTEPLSEVAREDNQGDAQQRWSTSGTHHTNNHHQNLNVSQRNPKLLPVIADGDQVAGSNFFLKEVNEKQYTATTYSAHTSVQPPPQLNAVGTKPTSTIVQERKRPRKYAVYIIAMPTFGYQRIESNVNDIMFIESIKRIPAFSIKRLGVRAEIGVEYKLSPRMKVFGGLLYYQRKQTIDFTEKQVDSLRITGANGEVTVEPVFKSANKSIEYELKNIGLQAGLNYELSRKKFLHVLGTGIELHKPLNKAAFHEISMGFGQKPDYYVFYNLYYRLQYPSEGRLRAVLQPSLNYSLYIHQNWNAPFYVKPYGLGLHVGCTYSF